VEVSGADLGAEFGTSTLGETLLAPTRIYVRPVLALLQQVTVKGIAHITGGGIVENVPRVLPEDVKAVIHRDSWSLPPVFRWLQAQGRIEDTELHRVFNCGIGMVVVVAQEDAGDAISLLQAAGEQAWIAGTVEPRAPEEAWTIVR
jgi:phosphoribosylformylglycinamidine cyclo-ligase